MSKILSNASAECYLNTIKTAGLPPGRVASFLCPVKDDVILKVLGIDFIPYECGKVL
jgi:hypothetical protein